MIKTIPLDDSNPTPPRLRDIVRRWLIAALLWWILTDGATDSWLIGVPVTLVTALMSAVLMPPLRVSVVSAARFIGFFLLESLRGGADVARRALHPQLPMAPGLLNEKLRPMPAPARVSVANFLSLVPGTLCTEVKDDTVQIHALDIRTDNQRSLSLVQDRLGVMFKSGEQR